MPEDQRFYTLDAMRGIAAIAVVWLHVGESLNGYTPGNAYLAVDFFFMLSGFVLMRAYGTALMNTLTPRGFMEMRIIRLYPMFAIGLLFGMVEMLGRNPTSQLAMGPSASIFGFVTNALMLPDINSKILFPFNNPGWSLFLEFLINILFATFLIRIPMRALTLFCGIMGAVLFCGMFFRPGYNAGPVWIGAWASLFRVGFAFPLGVILAATYEGKTKRRSLSSVALTVGFALLLITTPPYEPGWVFPAVMVFMLMPAILWFSALRELPRALHNLSTFLGDISYPLYAVHFPLLQIFSYLAIKRLHLPAGASAVVFIASAIALSWFLAHHVDAPVRRWLNGFRKRHYRARRPAPAIPPS